MSTATLEAPPAAPATPPVAAPPAAAPPAVPPAAPPTDAPPAGDAAPPAEPPPPPPPYYLDMWDKDGKLKPKYQELLPPEFDDRKDMLAEFDSFDAITKALKDNMTTARSKGVKALTPESTPEEIARFREAMGIQPTPYEFKPPAKLPPGTVWKEDRAKEVGALAHELNMTRPQAEKMLEKHLEYIAADAAERDAADEAFYQANAAKEKDVLKMTFGGNLDSTVNKAQRVALLPEYGLPVEAFDPQSRMFIGPGLLKLAADMFEMRGESQMPAAAFVQNHHVDPVRDAYAIQNDEGHPLHKKFLAGDPEVIEKIRKAVLGK